MVSSSSEMEQINGRARAIPRIIHFIWSGAPIPEDDQKVIIDWAQKTRRSGYQIKLWTDPATINEPLRSKRLSLEGVELIDWRHELPNEDPRYKKIRSLSEQILQAGRRPRARINYSAISDLHRFLVVHAQGGLYVDTDNFIVEANEDIGDIFVDSMIGTRILLRNACILAAVPNAMFVDNVISYFARLHDMGMAANPMNVDMKAYARLRRYESADDSVGFEPELVDDERVNSLAYWVTQTDYIHVSPHQSKGQWSELEEPKSIHFLLTMNLTGPEFICQRFYRTQNIMMGGNLSYFPQLMQRFIPEPLPGIYELKIDTKQFMIRPGLVVADGQKGSWYHSKYDCPEGFDYSPLYHSNTRAIPKKIHQIVLTNQPDKRVLGRGRDLSKAGAEQGYTTTVWITGNPEVNSDSETRYNNWLLLEFSKPLEIEAKAYVMHQLARNEMTSNERLLCELIISTLILLQEGGLVLPCGYGSWAGLDLGEIKVPIETGVKISSPQSILRVLDVDNVVGQTYLPSVIACSPEINSQTFYLEHMLERLISLTTIDLNSLSATDIQQALISPLANEKPCVESGSKFVVYRIPPIFYCDHLVWIGNSLLFYNTAPEAQLAEINKPLAYGLQSNSPQAYGDSDQGYRFFQSPSFDASEPSPLPALVGELNLLIKNAIDRCPIPDNYSFQMDQAVLNQFLSAMIQGELELVNVLSETKTIAETEMKEPIMLIINALDHLGNLDNGQLPQSWEGQLALNLLSELRGKTIIRDDYKNELEELEADLNHKYPKIARI